MTRLYAYGPAMSTFLNILLVSPLADGKTWVLMKAFDFQPSSAISLRVIEAEQGFQTDFASIPRPFWIVLPKWGKYGNAAVIHDWLYWAQPAAISRAMADLALREGMRALKVPRWQELAIYYAVRAFGWLAWMRNHAEREDGFNRVLSQLPSSAIATGARIGQYRRLLSHAFKTSTGVPPSAA